MFDALTKALDTAQAEGRKVPFWLRDDDAVEPGAALDRLLELGRKYHVPLTLAVIPRDTGCELSKRLDSEPGLRVAVHGWSHENHETEGKAQELGPARPAVQVLAELSEGRGKLRLLHGERALDLLVPPWNRIAPEVEAGLMGIGFRAISTFGAEAPTEPGRPVSINTHVDPIDWRGTRSLRAPEAIVSEAAARVATLPAGGALGLLTHHLAHDEAIWAFVEGFLAATAGHPAVRWVTPDKVISVK